MGIWWWAFQCCPCGRRPIHTIPGCIKYPQCRGLSHGKSVLWILPRGHGAPLFPWQPAAFLLHFIYLLGRTREDQLGPCLHSSRVNFWVRCCGHEQVQKVPGGPARQEGPLISSSVQSGCLTRHGAEVVMSSCCPPVNTAHRRARTFVCVAWDEEVGTDPAQRTSKGYLDCFYFWQIQRNLPFP